MVTIRQNRKDHSLPAIFVFYSIFSNRNQISLSSSKVYDKLISLYTTSSTHHLILLWRANFLAVQLHFEQVEMRLSQTAENVEWNVHKAWMEIRKARFNTISLYTVVLCSELKLAEESLVFGSVGEGYMHFSWWDKMMSKGTICCLRGNSTLQCLHSFAFRWSSRKPD